MKKLVRMTAVGAALTLALAACGEAPEDDAPTEDPGTDTETADGEDADGEPGGEAASDFLGCMVSDFGGFDDKSFNETSLAGLNQAVSELGIESSALESQDETEYGGNVGELATQGCDIIVTVGFALSDATAEYAEANPDTSFAIVDENLEGFDNVKSLVFNTHEAAFLAGYAAAGFSESGVVATFGGMEFPTVTIFMDGFAQGVAQYNEDNGEDVTVLGWNSDTGTGSFTGDFDNVSNGLNIANQQIADGADVIMPVAGPVGMGALQAAAAADGDVYVVGVDSDWYESMPEEYHSLILTSVEKKMDVAVYEAISSAVDGSFTSEPFVGTLENSGVDISPFHDLDGEVSDELKAAIDDYRQQLISGEFEVSSESAF